VAAPGGVDRKASEHARKQHAENPAHHMDTDDVERVVVAEPVLQADSQVAHDAGRQSDGDRGDWLHISG